MTARRGSAQALLSALGRQARTRRLAPGLRLAEVREPYHLDEDTRRLVAEALRPMRSYLHAPDGEQRSPLLADRLALLDGLLVVVGAAVRGSVGYTMLRVHRRPVMWLDDVTVAPDADGLDLLRRAVGRGIAREWRRHGRPRRWYIAGLTHRTGPIGPIGSTDHVDPTGLGSLVPGAGGRQPGRGSRSHQEELAAVVEALGSWVLTARPRHGLAPEATFDVDAGGGRVPFGAEQAPGWAPPDPAAAVRQHGASLVVLRSPLGASLVARRLRGPRRPSPTPTPTPAAGVRR